LLNDALHCANFLSLKLKENNELLPSFQSLVEDKSSLANELTLLASNIRKEVCDVLNFFLSFLRKYEEKKAHNMVPLMLDPRFKSLHIITSFVGRDQEVVVEEYDKKSLYLMLVKCHEHLHPYVRSFVNQDVFFLSGLQFEYF
jgi:hypothetical protein